MKKILFLALMITAVTGFFNQPVAVYAGDVKVEVCHIPPGDPTNFHTLKVSDNAAPAHLGHGDFLGSCDTPAEIRCDDGNACTIDAYVPGTVTCDNTQPVQCGGDLCSNTTCDPVDGCVDAPTMCDSSDPCIAVSICDPNDGLCNSTATSCAAGEVCEPGLGCVPDVCQSDAQCQQELDSPLAICSSLGDCRVAAPLSTNGAACTVSGDCAGTVYTESCEHPCPGWTGWETSCQVYSICSEGTCKTGQFGTCRNFPMIRGHADADGQDYYAPMLCPIGEADDAITAHSDAPLLGHWQVR